MGRDQPHPLATFQWVLGGIVLAMAAGFYVLDRMEPPGHFIAPRFFAFLLAPFGTGLVVSGFALRARWPGWQLLQLTPWVAFALTVAWFRSLR